jgi:TonB family protein
MFTDVARIPTLPTSLMRILTVFFAALIVAAPAAAQQTPPADTSRVFELHQVQSLPRPQNVPELVAALQQAYPPELRAAGVGGTVQLSFVVGADGSTGAARVLSATDSAFIAPSLQALSVLRFTPAQVGGRPVAVRVEQPLQWSVAAPADTAEVAHAPEEAEDPKHSAAARAKAADTGRVYELRAVTELPRPVSTYAFQQALARGYPPALRNRGEPGRVIVRMMVDEEGRVQNARVTRSSDRAFDEPTLDAVKHLRFQPARLNGHPVRVWVEQPIDWHVVPEPNGGMQPRP